MQQRLEPAGTSNEVGTDSRSIPGRFLDRACAGVPYAVIVFVITMTCLPSLRSGDKLLINADFFQYASRHEAVRKSIVEYHTIPLRSHWFGGGYPTIGDPEDPTFNPLVVFPILFGTVMGLKVIVYVSLLIGGLATYALARCILGYTRWGALFSGLVYGTCLFVPMRIIDGNYNEVYAAFLPLCLLLIGLACRGRKFAIALAPFVMFTMLSDGKLNALMAMFYAGVVCFVSLIPGLRTFATGNGAAPLSPVDYRPLRFFLLILGLTALIGMARYLPARDLIESHGGIQQMLAFHPKTYQPGGIVAYNFEQLWKGAIGMGGRNLLMTVGWLPVVLSGIALLVFWRQSIAWAVGLVLFGWLAMAHHAPFDLLKLLWNLPVFEAIYRPDKYFSFGVAFSLALLSGRSLSLLRQLHSRWAEGVVAVVLIAFATGFLYPKVVGIHRQTYSHSPPKLERPPAEGFFHIDGRNLPRTRSNPPHSLAYFNLLQNIGTTDWYTGIPLPSHVTPRYFVGPNNKHQPNLDYRAEAYFAEADGSGRITAEPIIRPNSITVPVEVKSPGVLVINQNFHRDWHADHGKLLDLAGRLALRLEEPGSYTIHLRYHPRSFYLGLAVMFLSLLGLIWVCWAYTTGRLQRWSVHASPPIQRGSRAILWLIA